MSMKMSKTFLDISKIVMWADSPVEEGKSARLSVSLRDGNPRFVVNTGVKGKEGMINFPMQIPDTVTIMTILKDVAKGEKGKIVTANAIGRVYQDNKVTNETKDLASLHIGKNNEGIVFLSVTTTGRPKIVFPFKPSKWFTFHGKDKQPIDPEYISSKMAESFATMVLDVVTRLILKYTEEEYTNGTRTPVDIQGNDSTGKPASSKQPVSKFEDLDELSL